MEAMAIKENRQGDSATVIVGAGKNRDVDERGAKGCFEFFGAQRASIVSMYRCLGVYPQSLRIKEW